MGHRQGDDERFFLEDAMLSDLLDDLATEDALMADVSRENGAPIASHGAAIALDASEVSLSERDANDGDASETASQTSSDNNQAPVKKPMTNSTRVRMKQELSYLRKKVVELEQELEAAKRNATAVTADSANEDANGSDAALVNVQGSLWERVARHQRVEKQKSERKNAELRLMLEDQLKIAKSLEKALRKRPSAMLPAGLIDEFDLNFPSKRLCSGNPQDPATFERLSERADRSYEELSAIWQRIGFDTSKSECNDSQVLLDDASRLYLEVTNAKIVPFSTEATDRAAWACISQPKLKFLHGVYHGVKATPDSIHSHSEMTMRVGSAEARMNMAIVTKRFVEKDRIVYVLESSTVGGGSREVLQNVQIVERGWVVLEPVRTKTVINVSEPDAEPIESAIIQVCMRLMPAVAEDIMDKPEGATTGALTDMMLAAFQQNLGFLFQTIENMLVEQMLLANGMSAH